MSNGGSGDLEGFLQMGGNRNVTMTIEHARFHTLPGDIEDTSFINPRAHEHCSGGYRWMTQQQGLPGHPDNGGNHRTLFFVFFSITH